MTRNAALASLLLLFALPVHSALAKCPGETQTEMNQCAGEAADRATQAMKATYSKVHAQLEPEDRADLFKSQVAWIQYMRAWCLTSTVSSKGGSIRPLEVAMCHESMTKTRDEELKSI